MSHIYTCFAKLTLATEDELQNVEMAEHERTKKRLETKIKKRNYTGFDDDEFIPGLEGQKRSILSKYDEDLGIKREMVCQPLATALNNH